MVNTPQTVAKKSRFVITDTSMQTRERLPPSCCRLIVALVPVAKRCLHMRHTLIRPPNQISFTPVHPPRHTHAHTHPRSTYLMKRILSTCTAALLIGALLLATRNVIVASCFCFFLFAMLPGCAAVWQN